MSPKLINFDISELGEPTTFDKLLKGRVKLKEPSQLQVVFLMWLVELCILRKTIVFLSYPSLNVRRYRRC